MIFFLQIFQSNEYRNEQIRSHILRESVAVYVLYMPCPTLISANSYPVVMSIINMLHRITPPRCHDIQIIALIWVIGYQQTGIVLHHFTLAVSSRK